MCDTGYNTLLLPIQSRALLNVLKLPGRWQIRGGRGVTAVNSIYIQVFCDEGSNGYDCALGDFCGFKLDRLRFQLCYEDSKWISENRLISKISGTLIVLNKWLEVVSCG